MDDSKQFEDIVKNTSLFNEVEKQYMLEAAPGLPEEVKQGIIEDIEGFEKRSEGRKTNFFDKVRNAFNKYRSKVEGIEGLTHEEKTTAKKDSEQIEEDMLSELKKNF
jgi:hypothetical protein